jgi:hypothetical protein
MTLLVNITLLALPIMQELTVTFNNRYEHARYQCQQYDRRIMESTQPNDKIIKVKICYVASIF